MSYNKRTDLTRWNRAKLSEFRYVDGNAPIYLEALRQELTEQFESNGKVKWEELLTRFPELANETAYQTKKRLLEQYYAEKSDYAWEIVRTFSRSVHVLSEYINAYANEAYIGTASEWDSLNKLVSMLGYRPSPPSSASTYIGLLYKDDTSGTVEKGFAVKNEPEPGNPTVTFETLENYEGQSAHNLIYLKDWNKNFNQIIEDVTQTYFNFYLDTLPENISVGDLGVLAGGDGAIAVQISAINSDDNGEFLVLNILSDNPGSNFPLYDSILYIQPEFIKSPLALGIHSVNFGKTVAMSESDIVFAKKSSNWKAYSVIKSEYGFAQFDSSASQPQLSEKIFRSLKIKKQLLEGAVVGHEVFVLPEDMPGSRKYFIKDNLDLVTEEITPETIEGVGFKYIDLDYDGEILYPDSVEIGRVKEVALTDIRFSGKPKNINSKDWMLFSDNGDYTVSEITSVNTDKDWYTITVEDEISDFDLGYTSFNHVLNHSKYNINEDSPFHSDSSDSTTVLEVNNIDLNDSLEFEQKLLCSDEHNAFVVTLKDKFITGGILKLYLSPPFHVEIPDTIRHDLIIYGNAVKASHGKTQAEKILGSGDASKTNQRFLIASDKVSWIADTLYSTGVRSDLVVIVGSRVWEQVENLSASAPEDHHYEVTINQDNQLSVGFGDGIQGRRLPTGVDNVRVIYREGYGEEGNLAAGTLTKIAKKHRFIDDFVAPYSVSGGADKESTDSLRESAPATVLALSRAVSLSDYTHLISHHSMVWQAKAFERLPDRPAPSKIEIIVVAAGGKVFSDGDEIATQLKDYITAHSVPGTSVSVSSYQQIKLHLDITIIVDSNAFNSAKVEESVKEYLVESLSIKHQELGKSLYRTDILNLVEQVEGVENTYCEILDTPYSGMSDDEKPRLHRGDDGYIRKISIHQNQLLSLDDEIYPLTITIQEYQI